jgi:hypothetical protein
MTGARNPVGPSAAATGERTLPVVFQDPCF